MAATIRKVHKYRLILRGKTVDVAITNDLKRREGEHRRTHTGDASSERVGPLPQ